MATGAPAPSSRNLIRKVVIPVVAILAIVVGSLLLIKSQLPEKDTATATGQAFEAKVGATMPDLELKNFPSGGGKTTRISSIGKKVMLINFWATWCEACMVEMPSIVQLREKFKDRGFEVLGVSVDEEPDSVVPQAMKELGMKFPVFTDAQGEAAEVFDVHAIPLSAVIDGNRKILSIQTGDVDWMSKEVQARIAEWLKS